MTHIATVITDHGNIARISLGSYVDDELAGIGPKAPNRVEGSVPSADLIAVKLAGREFRSYAELDEAIAYLVFNDPDVFVPAWHDWV